MSPEPDFELHEAPLEDDAEHPVRPISWRVIALSALALALVIAGIAVAPQWFVSKAPAAAHPSPTATKASVISVGIISNNPNGLPPGWQYSQPTGARAIARSADGRVRYTCGRADDHNLILSVTHDGGESWSLLPQLFQGTTCSLALNATQPSLVAIAANSVGLEPTPAQCWRSMDGGANFMLITLPDQANCSGSIQWLGTTLFVGEYQGPMVSCAAKPHLIAKAAVDGTATWVTDIDRFRAEDFTFVGVSNGALYLNLTLATTPQALLVKSTDGGNTWQPVMLTTHNLALTLLRMVPDTIVWLAQTHNQLFASLDGGAHWRAGPLLPTGVAFSYYGGYITPDGTIVTQFEHNAQSDPGLQIYVAHLGNGATQANWQPLAPETQDFPVLAVDWDAQGRLTTLYGADAHDMLVTYAV